MKIFLQAFLLLLVMQTTMAMAYELIDQVGRRVNVPDNPQRIVSLAPNITEIVFLLGREERLVGTTQYSNYPAAAEKLPRVGSYVRLDLEKIIALKPDLCLGIKDGNPQHTVKKIEELGIPVYVINPLTLDDIIDVVLRFGSLLGEVPKSKVLAKDMKMRIDRVKERITQVSARPGVFFQIDAAPMISAGENTFIHELITIAGGRNLAAGSDMYPRFNWEEIIRLQPEIAIIASMAGGHSIDDLKGGWQKWPQIPAVRNNRIHVVDANLIDRPTPRLIEGLEEFARIIHPELFGETSEQ